MAKNRKEILPTNLAYPFPSKFHTSWPKQFSKVPKFWLLGRLWRQNDVMFSRYLSKIRVRGNRRHEYSFKNRTNWFQTEHADWTWLWNCYLWFLKFPENVEWWMLNFEIGGNNLQKNIFSQIFQRFFFDLPKPWSLCIRKRLDEYVYKTSYRYL